jgi:hypothetical protein
MSTTTDGVSLVQPLRRLVVMEVPRDFLSRAILLLVSKLCDVIVRMDQDLPDDIKQDAFDRRKFHLQLLVVGKTASPSRLVVFFRLCDLCRSADGGSEARNYFYAGHIDHIRGIGEVDEYAGNDFIGDEIIKSLYQSEIPPLFRSI